MGLLSTPRSQPPSSHKQKLSRVNCLMRPIFCFELLIKEQTQPTVNLVLGKKLGLQQTEANSQGRKDSMKVIPLSTHSAWQVTQTLAYHLGASWCSPGLAAPTTDFLVSFLPLQVESPPSWVEAPVIIPRLPWRPGPAPGVRFQLPSHS